mgnify:FL=1
MPWNDNTNTSATGATSHEDGETNSFTIELAQGSHGTPPYCAEVCRDLSAHGRSDWYLPSIEELKAIHSQSYLISGLDHTGTFKYWSSTEVDADNAYALRMDYGAPDIDDKNDTKHNCRCVRK